MEEALRRKASGLDLGTRPPSQPEGLQTALDLAEMALAVQESVAVANPLLLRQCWFANLTTIAACREFELPAREVIGGALFRAGPDRRDVVPFCGPDGFAAYPSLFHSWVEIDTEDGPWVVDLSTRRWSQVPGFRGENGARPVSFEHPIPGSVVAPKRSLRRWLPRAGEFYYSTPSNDMRFRRAINETIGAGGRATIENLVRRCR